MRYFEVLYPIVAVILYLAFVVAVLFKQDPRDGMYYNCAYSEISPDFPIEVKKMCRKSAK